MITHYSNLSIEELLQLLAIRTLQYNQMLQRGCAKEELKMARHELKNMINEYKKRTFVEGEEMP